MNPVAGSFTCECFRLSLPKLLNRPRSSLPALALSLLLPEASLLGLTSVLFTLPLSLFAPTSGLLEHALSLFTLPVSLLELTSVLFDLPLSLFVSASGLLRHALSLFGLAPGLLALAPRTLVNFRVDGRLTFNQTRQERSDIL